MDSPRKIKFKFYYWLIFLSGLATVSGCDNEVEPIYDEGELISGTEVTATMNEGAYTWDTMPDFNIDGTKIAYSDYATRSLITLDIKSGNKKILYKGGYAPDWSRW